MKSQNSRGSGGRRGRGSRRSNRSRSENPPPPPAAPQTLWQKIASFFKPAAKKQQARPQVSNSRNYPSPKEPSPRKQEIEVTSEKLYVGNLSYEATENDLQELFNGVGAVRSAEIVADRQNDRSKGFGFVTMSTVDEAKRAVLELHDKAFMGRKLVVNGARTSDRETNYRG